MRTGASACRSRALGSWHPSMSSALRCMMSLKPCRGFEKRINREVATLNQRIAAKARKDDTLHR
jgi:hypothetical protein